MSETRSESSAREYARRPYVGRSLLRFEDLRLVRGSGQYTDDLLLPRQCLACFVRSSHAHGNLRRINTDAARALPGVLAVFTGADYLSDGCGPIPQVPNPTDVIDYKQFAFRSSGARNVLDEPHLPLAVERVRYVGEPVAVVIAESQEAARDAAEQVEVEYETLPAIVDVLEAIAPGAPAIWPAAPDNVAFENWFGDREATKAAFESADLVVEQVFRNQRIATAQMEPRSCIGDYDKESEQYISIAGSQGVHGQKNALAGCLKVPKENVRVICPDTGGGFGSRTYLNPEQVIVTWAARRLGRPVKWTSDRSQAFLTDYQGRDLVTTARLALGRDGRIRAYEFELLGNAGAHTVSYVPLNNGYRVSTTVYDIPVACARVRAVMTNTISTGPFRGAGRPEATLAIERLLDIAAGRLGMDRIEIRRRNMVRKDQLPYRTTMGLNFDSGDFIGNMDRALVVAQWNSFEGRRAEARRRGRLLGIGIANYVESPVGFPHERVEARVGTDDMVELAVGTQSTGQGHETTFAQVMADQLGVTPEQIRFIGGDSAKIASGGGSHSDRSMRFAGTLMFDAGKAIVARGRRIAAAMLAVGEADVSWEEGFFSSQNSNRRLTIFDVARAAASDSRLPDELRGPLSAEATFTGRIPAHPTGAAICEVELDPDTGVVRILRYTSVDDAGHPINPMILHGQVHGGIAQGAGQALIEEVVYQPGSGEMLTGSFMDYGIPRADMFPFFHVELAEHPTHGNPLRIKGGGESGITPCLAVVMNAVVDALSSHGIEHIDMPATPSRVWKALHDAKS